MIETLLALFMSKGSGIIAGIVAALAALAVMFRAAFKAGKSSEVAKDVEASKTAGQIAADNARLSDAAVKERLKAKWQKL